MRAAAPRNYCAHIKTRRSSSGNPARIAAYPPITKPSSLALPDRRLELVESRLVVAESRLVVAESREPVRRTSTDIRAHEVGKSSGGVDRDG